MSTCETGFRCKEVKYGIDLMDSNMGGGMKASYSKVFFTVRLLVPLSVLVALACLEKLDRMRREETKRVMGETTLTNKKEA